MPMMPPTLVTNVMELAKPVLVKDLNVVYLVMENSILKTTTVNQNVKNQEFMKMTLKTNVTTVTQLVLNVHALHLNAVPNVLTHTTSTKTPVFQHAPPDTTLPTKPELVNHVLTHVQLVMEDQPPNVHLVKTHYSYT
jgi:uncharacterized protein involved in tolerance to divalent cations